MLHNPARPGFNLDHGSRIFQRQVGLKVSGDQVTIYGPLGCSTTTLRIMERFSIYCSNLMKLGIHAALILGLH